jgi:hypothetical protein
LVTDDLLELPTRAFVVAERLVNAGDDETKPPVRRIVTKVAGGVVESGMVSPRGDAYTHQPVDDCRFVVAMATRGAEVLLGAQ